MNTPIVDFVKQYAASDMSRLHMPGHKGKCFLGCEPFDITEVNGADVLYSAEGIIEESEQNATNLFGTAHSFYSTEGSSLVIRAMLAIVAAENKSPGERTTILAGRNAHKTLIYGCALLDIDVEWMYPENFEHLCSCKLTAADVRRYLENMEKKPAAVYLTSPDYLGFVQDIKGIANVCKEHQIPLLVDNAHGAYQKFLKEDMHPITLGATMCSDSAHKTLPVLTGGAYLHISKDAPGSYVEMARNMLSVFASTSPSYLTMQSLDLCNKYLEDGFQEKLEICISKVAEVKQMLKEKGFVLEEGESLKIVINAMKSGYTGEELYEILWNHKIESEFHDEEFLVMMFSPEVRDVDYRRVKEAFEKLQARAAIKTTVPPVEKAEVCMSIREAMFSAHQMVDVQKAEGEISGSPTVSCPPAVPIVISGERITKNAIALFQHYGIEKIEIVCR